VTRTGTAKSSEMLCGAGTSTFRFRAGRMGTFRAPSLLTSRHPIEEGLTADLAGHMALPSMSRGAILSS
jgi:hypothetical protein